MDLFRREEVNILFSKFIKYTCIIRVKSVKSVAEKEGLFFVGEYYADIIVDDKVIIEQKT